MNRQKEDSRKEERNTVEILHRDKTAIVTCPVAMDKNVEVPDLEPGQALANLTADKKNYRCTVCSSEAHPVLPRKKG